MDRPEHLGVAARKHLTSKRARTIAFVAAIHVAAIYALTVALVPHALPKIPNPFVFIKTKTDMKPVDQGPIIVLKNPSGPLAKPPVVPDSDRQGLNTITTTGGTETGGTTGPTIEPLRGIAGTHTTPPYPLSSVRLGEEGTVRLQLSVAADGSVFSATVEHSSGSYALDQAAVEWVRKHWRYQPRTVDGLAQATTTEADIRFDLRNAR
jgi:TonB family protein